MSSQPFILGSLVFSPLICLWAVQAKEPENKLSPAEAASQVMDILQETKNLISEDKYVDAVELNRTAFSLVRSSQSREATFAIQEIALLTKRISQLNIEIAKVPKQIPTKHNNYRVPENFELDRLIRTKQEAENLRSQFQDELRRRQVSDKKGRDRLLSLVQDQAESIKVYKKEYEQASLYLYRLEKKPSDPEANLSLGKYYALTTGNWNKGVPMLALGPDSDLEAAAVHDLESSVELDSNQPGDSDKQVALADEWWRLSENESGLAKLNLQKRAAYWYAKAMPRVKDSERTRLEIRLKEIERK